MDCKAGSPAIDWKRDRKREKVKGCPILAIPGGIRRAVDDYHKMKEGTMQGYAHDQYPARLADIIPMYKDWYVFFRTKDSEDKPEAISQLERFRAREARR